MEKMNKREKIKFLRQKINKAMMEILETKFNIKHYINYNFQYFMYGYFFSVFEKKR